MTNYEVEELYKFAVKVSMKFNHGHWCEDDIQELVTYAYHKSKLYDSSRGNKSTFYYHIMNSKLLMMYRERQALIRKEDYNTLSLNMCINRTVDDRYCEPIDTLTDKSNIGNYESYGNKKTIEHILPLIGKELKRNIFDGKNQSQIAKELGLTQPQISRLIKANINKIKSYCIENDLQYTFNRS